MAPGDTARLYHLLSSYTGDPADAWPSPIDHPLVRQDFAPNHRPTFPAQRKVYPDSLPTVELPASWPSIHAPALELLAGRHESAARELDLEGLARLLHLSAGVVRVAVRRDGRRFLFRPAGSAGGLFPLELYVAARGVSGLPDGVYWYDPVAHALRQVGPPATGEATTIVVTGIPWRTGWRYAERGLRHIYWDAGTMLANTLALAEAGGFQPRLLTRFPDAAVARLVGADGTQEFPVALVTLGRGAPAIGPAGEAATGMIDVAPVEFPLVSLAQHAGDDERLGVPWPIAQSVEGELPVTDDLDTVILRRGSARTLVSTAAVDFATFERSLAVSLRGTRVPHFIAVHAVEGLAPGLYRWPDIERPLRRGSLRHELWAACYGQDLGRDAAFVVIGAVDLDGLDDRGYREAQLDAGMAEGRLHLAAYALGIGASGMTFIDSAIPALVGEPLAGLLFTCVGVPLHRTKRAGTPRYPADVSEP
jgi:SagB-type dehydrogenase family enzyme